MSESILIEMKECLYDKCLQDVDLLSAVIDEYVNNMSDSKLDELYDFLTNNFGDD